MKVAADFNRHGRSDTGQLDLAIAIGTTTPRVEFVKPGSRAERAGVQPGDVILQIDDHPVTEALDVLDANFYLDPRHSTKLRVLRGLDERELTAPPVEVTK